MFWIIIPCLEKKLFFDFSKISEYSLGSNRWCLYARLTKNNIQLKLNGLHRDHLPASVISNPASVGLKKYAIYILIINQVICLIFLFIQTWTFNRASSR